MARTGLYFSHPACLEHDPRVHMPEHPDTPERLQAIEAALGVRDWLGWERREAPSADDGQLELVHTARHVEHIRELALAGGGAIDPDTFVGEQSFRAALHAAGGACEMARALMTCAAGARDGEGVAGGEGPGREGSGEEGPGEEGLRDDEGGLTHDEREARDGESRFGFCAVRPSGHHAEPGRAMGFCLFNNIAVAAALAIRELGAERVFILDWDVHHGNGTAEAFRTRSDILFVSIHQSGIYPGTGPLTDAGSGEGLGCTINLPVPAGSDGELWLSLIEHIVIPVAGAFEPDLVLVSAGFDAHLADPLAGCRLDTSDFAEMARHVRDFALKRSIPLGLVLEGGYNLDALAESVVATIAALSDDQPAESAAPEPFFTSRVAAHVGHYWPL